MYHCEVSLFSGSRLWPTSMLVKRTHSCFKLNKKINKNKKMFSCVFFIVIKGRRSHTLVWKGFKSECSWLTEASTSELSAIIRYKGSSKICAVLPHADYIGSYIRRFKHTMTLSQSIFSCRLKADLFVHVKTRKSMAMYGWVTISWPKWGKQHNNKTNQLHSIYRQSRAVSITTRF